VALIQSVATVQSPESIAHEHTVTAPII